MKNMKKYMFCNNCGKQGHLYHRCKKPISSIGIIAFRKSKTNNKYEYLMIQRNNSLGYIEFLLGRYDIHDINSIIVLFKQMTKNEIQRIKKYKNNFITLWNILWNPTTDCGFRLSLVVKYYNSS